MLRLTNCHLCDKGTIVHNADLYIDTKLGTIVDAPKSSSNVRTIDLKGKIVAPGYIDIQNNGIYGLNFSALNETSTEADIAEFRAFYKDVMAKFLKTGVTSLCPTVTSNFPEVYQKVLPIYKRSRSSAMSDSLGAHLEGPFISKAKKGCHPVETFVDAEKHELSEIYGAANLVENVAIVTAAPEIPGVLDLIPELLESTDVVFSIGHTSTDYATGLKAVQNGASMVTHLYNAMPQPHHRDIGVVGLVTSPQAGTHTPYFGLICDGVHVAPSMCVLAYRASPDKCVLTTDAMHLIGLPDGTYQWDKQKIVKTGASLYLEGTTTLAGAATDLSVCVQNLVKWANISLAQAVQTVTNNAADSLRIKHKGYLNAGCDADLVILDNEGNVEQVFKLGVPVRSETRLSASL
ncbi:CIC11C00000004418 [Sungouiella intermedia]|uniref:N-acetylglucosamine-6-phosphate deacetylase n=1 Tax=Sungouiella intermedia TaxID=45354 RepID=A0A1L0BRJ3_9ASCO|nr:CIC11C00000004418 [[Candida] intermedia]